MRVSGLRDAKGEVSTVIGMPSETSRDEGLEK